MSRIDDPSPSNAKARDKAEWAKRNPRQAAVDARGYYNEADIREAKRDPKVRHNFELMARERKRKAQRSGGRK